MSAARTASASPGRRVVGAAVTRIPNLPTWMLLAALIIVDATLQLG